eukprot:Sspe_Gene.99374::Locus_72908_Transcript_1_1_Confidence_1.000_Length_462::g.99374::m.99374
MTLSPLPPLTPLGRRSGSWGTTSRGDRSTSWGDRSSVTRAPPLRCSPPRPHPTPPGEVLYQGGLPPPALLYGLPPDNPIDTVFYPKATALPPHEKAQHGPQPPNTPSTSTSDSVTMRVDVVFIVLVGQWLLVLCQL